MKSKDKSKKHMRVTLKNLIYAFASCIIILYMYIFYNLYFPKSEVYAKEDNSQINNIKISNADKVNIDEIINQNSSEGKKEEYFVEEVELEYITKYNTNPELPKGMIQVVQEGREGKQEITKKRIYENGNLVSEEQVSSKITKAAINKIVDIGGASYTSTYKVKKGDTVYVTSDRLSVYVEPNQESTKIATLAKGDELNVLELADEWYRISSQSVIGYVKTESTTYLNPNTPQEEEITNTTQEKSKSDLISKLSFDMSLNKPSELSLEQFKKVLSDSKDKNKIFENNAQYFYYIEKQYNINGIFVAAVGIHESAWGTSNISKQKNNLFGYGAYDSNPYNGAYSFSSYSECIDLIARVFVKYYINPKGTKIYDGETATGSYYNGPTLSGVNTKYATDKNWANSVYNHMKYLYNKL